MGAREVDYVLRLGEKLAAIEVKTSDADDVSGMHEFQKRYPHAKIYLVGGQGMPLETAFTMSAEDYL